MTGKQLLTASLIMPLMVIATVAQADPTTAKRGTGRARCEATY
jgi:hypothetical protein